MISIITPSLNRASFIRGAIESVLAQNYDSFEHIIVDGGSTDGTLQLLKEYPHLIVVSEPDRGVYDALNKGIRLARGDIIGQLNTDDYYGESVLTKIMEIFDHDPAVDAVVGGARVFEVDTDGNQKTVSMYEPVGPTEIIYRSTVGTPIFNAWFFRKSLFGRIGPYSLDFPIASDRDFLIRCHMAGINLAVVNSVVYHYCQHSGSLSINDRADLRVPLAMDALKVAEKYFGLKLPDQNIRELFRKWHLALTLNLAAGALRRGNIAFALNMVRRGWRQNPLWPFHFMKDAFRGIGRDLRNLFGIPE